jgi:hypothetical protein
MCRFSNASSIAGPLLMAMAVLLVGAGPVSAEGAPARLGLTPVGQDGSYFELRLKPGEATRLQVEAANFGDERALARTYASDVYSIVNGGFGARLFGERPSGTTLWITYPTKEIALGPGEAIAIDFKVEVPADTPPGEYVAALVIENAEPLRGSGTIAVDQINRNAIAVAIEVPGEQTPALAIGAVRQHEVAGLSVVSFEVHNSGNVHLRPAGDFFLRNGAGEEIAASSVAMDTVYARTSTLLEAPALELLGPGEYCAELTLTDQETGATDTTSCLAFTIVAPADSGVPLGDLPTQVIAAIGGSGPILPVLFLLLLLMLGAGATILVLGRRRRRAALADGPAVTTMDRPDAGPATEAALPRIIGTLRRLLDAHPEISRAWIIERGTGFVLAFEGGPGTTPADASRLTTALQERADREIGLTLPMQVVCLQEAGPVERMTAEAVPFYVKVRET